MSQYCALFEADDAPFTPQQIPLSPDLHRRTWSALSRGGFSQTEIRQILDGWMPLVEVLRDDSQAMRKDRLENFIDYANSVVNVFLPYFGVPLAPLAKAVCDLQQKLALNEIPAPRKPLGREAMESLRRRHDNTCAYCRMRGASQYGPDGKPWNFDHVVPVSRGGHSATSNLCLSCWTCNSLKGTVTAGVYRAAIEELPEPLHLFLAHAESDKNSRARAIRIRATQLEHEFRQAKENREIDLMMQEYGFMCGDADSETVPGYFGA